MRRNVLVGLAACALPVSWPASLFGAVPTAQSVERADPDQTKDAWLWDGMRGPMTMPQAVNWIDPWPCGVVGAGALTGRECKPISDCGGRSGDTATALKFYSSSESGS